LRAKPGITNPVQLSLAQLRREVDACRNCDLHTNGTRAVSGEGSRTAAIVLVGEQPGDLEERNGRPFVGPAGALLDKALTAAGIGRERVYLTNIVKHFNFEERGTMRLHKRPRATHVRACRPWLLAELAAIRPTAVVLLGATAASGLLGSGFRLSQQRGSLLSSSLAPVVMATWHPSLALRAPDAETRARVFSELASDLGMVARQVAARTPQ
jgi:DNA polymerase